MTRGTEHEAARGHGGRRDESLCSRLRGDDGGQPHDIKEHPVQAAEPRWMKSRSDS